MHGVYGVVLQVCWVTVAAFWVLLTAEGHCEPDGLRGEAGLSGGEVSSLKRPCDVKVTPLQLSLWAGDGLDLQAFSEDWSVRGLRLSVGRAANSELWGLDVGVGLGAVDYESWGIQVNVGGSSALRSRGLQVSGVWNDALVVQGAQVSVGVNRAKLVYGMQIGSINICDDSADDLSGVIGCQIGICNDTQRASLLGFQVGCINRCARDYDGACIQAGLLNSSGVMTGAQIGVVNCCKRLYGFQIKLVNIIADERVPFLPLLNVGF